MGIGAGGVRLNAVDYDGDGWTDLAVRRSEDEVWLLRNTGSGQFEDVTEASGVKTSGQVWIWADVDNDFDLDVFTGTDLMVNNGDGTFSAGPPPGADNPYGASFVDIDLDGVVDLWATTYASTPTQDQLFRGRGGGRFADRTEKLGLTTQPWASVEDLNQARAHANSWAAEACDLNNDGWPELLSSSYGRAPNHLWRNEGGSFVNASLSSGYAFDTRTDWTDNESARCWCSLHPDDDDCSGVPAPAITCTEDADAFRWNHTNDRELFRLGGNSGQTTCRDLDNDGWIDLLTSEIVHWDVGSSSDPTEILFNTGSSDVVFARPGNDATGLVRTHEDNTWDDGDITGGTLDFDNDGWADVYIGSSDYPGTRGLLYHQVAPRQFRPVPITDGIDHTRSHGMAVADFDRDGDLDVVVGHSTARCGEDCYGSDTVRLFENQSLPGNFIQLRLYGNGQTSNGMAIGARVEVTADGVTQVQEVSGGGGQFGAQSDLVLHFGLGQACEADVRVAWPDLEQTSTRFTIPAGYRYLLAPGGAPIIQKTP